MGPTDKPLGMPPGAVPVVPGHAPAAGEQAFATTAGTETRYRWTCSCGRHGKVFYRTPAEAISAGERHVAAELIEWSI